MEMPYCQKCGAELDENARYCPSCGNPTSAPQVIIERAERSSSGARIVLVIFGGIVLLVAFGLLVGGGALLWVNMRLIDSEGFLATSSSGFETDSYAIAFQHVNINFGEGTIERAAWSPSISDFVTIRINGSSNNASKNVFIGIARDSDVTAYLNNISYAEVTHLSISSSRTVTVEYAAHAGQAAPAGPTSQTFWVASKHGSGEQTLEWSPEAGSYWVVLMNEDGSADVDLDVSLGVKIPLLSTIGLALVAGGVVALAIGIVVIYLGVRK